MSNTDKKNQEMSQATLLKFLHGAVRLQWDHFGEWQEML